MKVWKHAKRNTVRSAYDFHGRDIGVWRGYVDGRWTRYPYAYVPQSSLAIPNTWIES